MIREKLKEIADLQLKHNEWLKNTGIKKVLFKGEYLKFNVLPSDQFLEKRKLAAKQLNLYLENYKSRINESISTDSYTDKLTFFKTSTEQGNYTEYAWSGYFHTELAPSASAIDCWYPVFLYSFDQKRIFLALAHSVTQFGNDLWAISEVATNAGLSLDFSSYSKRLQIKKSAEDRPDLGPYKKPSDGGNQYSLSCVAWYEYDSDDLPTDEQLIKDLISLVRKVPDLKYIEAEIIPAISGSAISVDKSDKGAAKKNKKEKSQSQKIIDSEHIRFIAEEAQRIIQKHIAAVEKTPLEKIMDISKGNDDLQHTDFRKSFDFKYTNQNGEKIGVEVKGKAFIKSASNPTSKLDFTRNEVIVHHSLAHREQIYKKIEEVINEKEKTIQLGIQNISQVPAEPLKEVLDQFDKTEIYRVLIKGREEKTYQFYIKENLILKIDGQDIQASLESAQPTNFELRLADM